MRSVADMLNDVPSQGMPVANFAGLNSMMPTTAFPPMAAVAPSSNDPAIKIDLDNSDLWQKFHQHTTEMIVNKTGRRMFPTLRFKVSGLDPSATYAVFLDIVPLDECRYKFQGNQWVVNGRADPLPGNDPRSRMYVHPDSPAPGHLWTRQPISFHRIKLTNNVMESQGNILLNSMHKYQPRLFILRLHDYFPTVPQVAAFASFPETSFVTVTAYQNNSVIQLKVEKLHRWEEIRANPAVGEDLEPLTIVSGSKSSPTIDHNPFAKGFRETGLHIDNKKRPSSELDGEESSNDQISEASSAPRPKRLFLEDSSDVPQDLTTKKKNAPPTASKDLSITVPAAAAVLSPLPSPALRQTVICKDDQSSTASKTPDLSPSTSARAPSIASQSSQSTALSPGSGTFFTPTAPFTPTSLNPMHTFQQTAHSLSGFTPVSSAFSPIFHSFNPSTQLMTPPYSPAAANLHMAAMAARLQPSFSQTHSPCGTMLSGLQPNFGGLYGGVRLPTQLAAFQPYVPKF